MAPMPLSLGASEYRRTELSPGRVAYKWMNFNRIEKGEASAKKLSEATGQRCVFAQADVRKPEQLKAAAKKCIDIFGKIDFVICGLLDCFRA